MVGSEDGDKRGVNADDVAGRTKNEKEASLSLQQLEAAARFGGLGLNVGNTEVMGCRIKKAEVSEEVENAIKERMTVKADGCRMWGWIAPANGEQGWAFQIEVTNKLKGRWRFSLTMGTSGLSN